MLARLAPAIERNDPAVSGGVVESINPESFPEMSGGERGKSSTRGRETTLQNFVPRVHASGGTSHMLLRGYREIKLTANSCIVHCDSTNAVSNSIGTHNEKLSAAVRVSNPDPEAAVSSLHGPPLDSVTVAVVTHRLEGTLGA